ncbi:NUDIX domain-containing protein [Streptomyces sp. NPDC085460]|uniref:NUDIX hydrolase n=1 Tax=Streptomyces sp. NPDC085460 TaxID=3365723 RepID=UPI0037D4AEC1
MRRTRPGIPEYWVLPGGGVEQGDASREAALHREIHEEIAGKADIVRLLHTRETDDERQLFHLARIATWSFDDRTGPEFSAEGRGEYALEEVPLTPEGLDGIASSPRRRPPLVEVLGMVAYLRLIPRLLPTREQAASLYASP